MNQHISLNIQAGYFLGAMGTGIGEQLVKRMGDGFSIVLHSFTGLMEILPY